MSESQPLPASLKKYHQAAIGFVLLNVAYLILTYWKVPSFDMTPAKAAGYLVFFIILVGVLATLIYRGSRKLAVSLKPVKEASR